MKNIEIKFDINKNPVIKFKNGGYIAIETAEAYLMLMILEKLEEIRCGIIDVEEAIAKNSA